MQSSESEADTGTASSLASSARSSTESLNEHIQEVRGHQVLIVYAFNQEKALVGAFSVIVKL